MNANNLENITGCTIVQRSASLLTIYKDSDGNVYTLENSGEPKKIASGALKELSVNLSEDDNLYVFYQALDGNIILLHFNGENWKKQIIQKNISGTVYNLKMYSSVTKNGIHLLYNIPSEIGAGASGSDVFKIVSQEMSGGKWFPHTTIADRVKDSMPVFSVHPIAGEDGEKAHHLAIYYRTETGETHFGFKEVYLPDNRSGFTALHSSLYSFSDISAATTKDGVHTAFVMRGMYQSQLLYRNKLGHAISAPLLIFESNRIESAALSVADECIQIVFSAGGYGFFKTLSTDCGKTFSRPQRLKPPVKGSVIKAEYLRGKNAAEGVYVYDVYTDSQNPGVILFHEDTRLFRLSENPREKAGENTKITESAGNTPEVTDTLISEKNGRISFLENKLRELKRELAEKNRQIVELTSMNSGKNKEIAAVASSFRETIKRLSDQSAEKDRLILRLRDELNAIKSAQQTADTEKEECSAQNTEKEAETAEQLSINAEN